MTSITAPDTATLGDVRVGHERTDTPPRRFPTPVRVLLACVAMFVATLSPAIVVLVPGLADRLETAPTWVQGITTPAVHVIALLTGLALVWLLMRYVDRRPFSDVGWTWNRRSLPALALGMGTTIVLAVFSGWVVDAFTDTRPEQYDAPGVPAWLVVVSALSAAFLLQGIGEELIWRGYVLQTLRTSPVVSVYISAAVFGALHLVSNGGQQNAWERIVYLAVPFGFALLAGALVLRTGSLWSAIGVHGGFHVASLIAGYWLAIGTGPLTWAVQGGVLAALGAVLLHRRPRD